MHRAAAATPTASSRPQRSGSRVDYAPKTVNEGTADEAIKYMIVHDVKASVACRKVGTCPMGVSRLIASLKEMGQWEPHVRAIRDGAAPAQPEDAPAPSSPPLVLPTPRSLRSQLDASATRLGDGRPYLNGASALTNPQATAVLRSCGKEGKGNKPELQAALATLLRELTPSVGSSDAGLDAARELVSAAEAQHRLLTAPQAPPPELTPAPEAAPAPPERPRRHARAT
mmetsp:Transcript_11169/g.35306  ORF Transcript_11169/g.35306 Transcript_11169/m.35306 type:complete len:228 (+) Transcript_11169:84-767(+)